MQHLTDLRFLDQSMPWPPPSQDERLTRYEKNQQLWDGDHDQVWGNWWRVLREDQEASLEIVYNWHKRFSTFWADMLVGTAPRFMATDENDGHHPENQKHVDRITGKDSNGYQTVLHETALDVSRYGDALQKISIEDGVANISAQPPNYWFPVVKPTDLKKITHHVLAWTVEIPIPDKVDEFKCYLWVEIHHKGSIEFRAHELLGEYIGQPVDLTVLDPDRKDPTLETNIDDFLIIPFQGLVTSDTIFGKDDYKDLDTIIQAVEIRAALINWILDKHSDPSMAGPEDVLEKDSQGNYVFKYGSRYFPFDSEAGETPPEYIVWDGKLDSAFVELDYLLDQLYIVSETTPAAFGMQKEGLAESGSALRRLMMTPLKKVERIRMRFDPSAKKAIQIAAMLENKNGGKSPILENLQIQWQDGLPPDPKEQAETEQIRTGNKPTSSQVSAARRIDGGTQEEAEGEIAKIQEEEQLARQAQLEDAEAMADVEIRKAKATGENTPTKTPTTQTKPKEK